MYNTKLNGMGCSGCSGMGWVETYHAKYQKGSAEDLADQAAWQAAQRLKYPWADANTPVGATAPGTTPKVVTDNSVIAGGTTSKTVADAVTGKVTQKQTIVPVVDDTKILGIPKNYAYIGGVAIVAGLAYWKFGKGK
jgi:hypothetical protein